MQIHITRDGQSFGPYTSEQVGNYLSTGEILGTDLAWHEGMTEWQPVNTLPQFQGSAFRVPPPIPASAMPEAEYHHVSIFKFIVFSAVSFGVYNLYWFYKNWKYIRDRDNLDIAPFWRMFFAPIWCYSLSKDVVEARGNSNFLASALVAISYFALSMLWRLPDPYWLFGFFAFVPLLYIVHQINQVNREKSLVAPYYSKFKIRHIVGVLFGALLTLSAVTSTLNLTPSTQVIGAERIPERDIKFLRAENVINETESILYFYSAGAFSIKEDGNIVTTERVISYELDPYFDSGKLFIYSAAFKDIADIQVTRGTSLLDNTVVQISMPDEDDSFVLLLSTEEGRDKLFTDKLMELWNQHRTAATTENL